MNEYSVSVTGSIVVIGQRLFDLSCLGLGSLLALGPFDWTTKRVRKNLLLDKLVYVCTRTYGYGLRILLRIICYAYIHHIIGYIHMIHGENKLHNKISVIMA